MSHKLLKWVGWLLVLLGVLGFVPGITTSDGLLLGVFEVNAAHNIVNLLIGILAIVFSGGGSARMAAIIFGLIYAIVGLLGLFSTGDVLGVLAANSASSWLHIVLAVLLLWAGFSSKKAGGAAPSEPAM
jgi:hypothetical protein